MNLVKQIFRKRLGLKINLVCRGGPENGPFSAGAARLINLVLTRYDHSIDGIYTISGPTPTALCGCVGEYDYLCNIWSNLTPKDIVGKKHKVLTFYRVSSKDSIFDSRFLLETIKKHSNLNDIFAPTSIPIKFSCIDMYTSERIMFSNKNPKNKDVFLEGAVSSMTLVPFFGPRIIYSPEKYDLLEKCKARMIENPDSKQMETAVALIDGGYKEGMLLEEAIRDGYNFIFLIDIHNLCPTVPNMTLLDSRWWPHILRSSSHYLSHANDERQYRTTDRINEEIKIKKKLEKVIKNLPMEHNRPLYNIINRMNTGRLRLKDKEETIILKISDHKNAKFFNFSGFEKEEVQYFLRLGHVSAAQTLKKIGFEFDENDLELDIERIITAPIYQNTPT